MRIVSIVGVELLGGIFILICLILALKSRPEYADKNSVPYVSHFETFDFEMAQRLHYCKANAMSQSGTYHSETPQFEKSHFENLLASGVTYIRKGKVFQMKKSSLEFVKSQLEEIRVSKNAEFSSGIAATLIAYINAEDPPETVQLCIDSTRCPNKINAIKELRMLIGCGLREAKDFVELGTPFLTTTDTSAALRAYRVMKQFAGVKVKGSPAMETLFS